MRRRLVALAATALAAGSLARCNSSSTPPPPGEADSGYTFIVGRDGIPFQVDGAPDGGVVNQLTVPVGQPVHWRFATSGFNVVSGTVGDGGCVPDNRFCSGVDLDAGTVDCSQAPLQTASTRWTYTFTAAGTYTYFSSPQCPEAQGAVVVQ